ncbi:protein serine/threonine phosphatase 2C [Cylindrobasidium torrendii FP15055 ss-10]|uniref:Protein serine/threonine phosphatase 2C n=1 Tax=Cylindrobasidium torrendii FP15055 ss-10 TaxID=1314674 RepID=A0A0D7BE84_9AGAR|nr:protein serine/threonine phosphatase 2C [Cylindrobasidium torrendii FP15055 ss-10]
MFRFLGRKFKTEFMAENPVTQSNLWSTSESTAVSVTGLVEYALYHFTVCGPEDGPWPRQFQVLDEEETAKELRALAKPQSAVLDGRRVDSLNFQPSPTYRTQDRYVVRTVDVGGRLWTLTGVFDGHLGDITVEHNAHREQPEKLTDPAFISDVFSRSITAFDDAIANDVLALFGGIKGLESYTDEDIRHVINDHHHGGDNFRKARLNMYGTTALVALVDPDHRNLWVANLGDCQAILVTSTPKDSWDVRTLTTIHNGDNEDEIERVRSQHPNEPECVVDGRVLGALAPTRSCTGLGDTPFKQPPEFTRRILYNLSPGLPDKSPWEEFLNRNKSPPYVSTEPEIVHRQLDDSTQRFLVLCSDGFVDLCRAEGENAVIDDWAKHWRGDNLALGLLHRALGGEDTYRVSKVLTLQDMEGAWIDDTALVVQTL